MSRIQYSVHANATFKTAADAQVTLDDINKVIYRYEVPVYASVGMSELSDEVDRETGFLDETYHDDQTMHKVYKTMLDAGLSANTVTDIVMHMQNAGILFRERVPE